MTVKVFVEGIADKKFITDYLRHLNIGYPNNFEIIPTGGGWTKLPNLDNQFIENTNDNGINLIIFDSNNDPKQRRTDILDSKDSLGIDFELFLLPDNQNSGDLEILLFNIINPKHQIIFDCFEKYQACLGNNSQRPYRIPTLKTKIYAYQDTLLSKRNSDMAKEDSRDYRNPDHWNLDDKYLEPLKKFLSPHL